MIRVLMFTPTARLEPEAFEALMNQTYAGPLDRLLTRDNPETEHPELNIVYNYQKAQRMFLAGQYDALFPVESDVIIPPNALERLIAADADIAYGVYLFRRGGPVLNITHPRPPYNSYTGHLADWIRQWGQVIECSGLGFGCTLIRRRVLELHELHSENGDGGDSDTVLANYARANGIKQLADTSVICGHKRPDSVILWPEQYRVRFEGTPIIIKREVRALKTFSFWAEDDSLYLCRPNDPPLALDYERAQELVESGKAEYV
jgi:hypothetical protein